MESRKLGTLDLSKNLLFGFEDQVYDTILYSIYRGIILGIPIEPVRVAEKDGKYFLTLMPDCHDSFKYLGDGGHHRAYAHYRLGVPLPVIFLPKKYAPSCGMHIKLIHVEEDTDNQMYEGGIAGGKNYLPLEGFNRPFDLEKVAKEIKEIIGTR